MSDALRWLARRDPPPPPSLRARIEDAVRAAELAHADIAEAAADAAGADAAGADAAETMPLPALLAAAGLERLRSALTLGDDRNAAYELLAADALLTYACEAAAEIGDDALARLHAELTPDRFAQLLEPPGAHE